MQQSLSDKLDFFSEIIVISLVAIEDEIIKLFITCLKNAQKETHLLRSLLSRSFCWLLSS